MTATMTPSILEISVSRFHGVTDTRPTSAPTLGTVLAAIRDGAYRPMVEKLRVIRRDQGEAAYKLAKKTSISVTFAGTFSYRNAKSLRQHSGILHGDIDHIGDVQAMKHLLCEEEAVVYCFISPGGDGLKVGVRSAQVSDDPAYQHAWQVVADHFHQRYGVTWDPSGKDVCRLCFMSVDPDIFINLHATVVPLPAPVPAPIPLMLTPPHPFAPYPDRKERYLRTALRNAEALLDRSQDGTRHATRLKAGRLLGGYVPEFLSLETAFQLLESAVLRNTRTPAQAMQTLRQAIAYGAQHPITLAQLEAERRAWKGAQG